MYNSKNFVEAIEKEGFSIYKDLIPVEMIKKLQEETQKSVLKEAEFHGTTDYRDFGVLQVAPIYGGSFLELLENRDLIKPFNDFLGEGCIIYVYISSCLPPGGGNFASRIHVDRPRIMPRFREALACLIPLDDFTKDNGCTYILPGSHKQRDQPTEDEFYPKAERFLAKQGDVLFFDLRTWHSAGMNNTPKWRNALAIEMVRPYMKQKFDIPRAISHLDISGLSEGAKQKLGFFSQPPANLSEFYAPPAQRTYRQASEWDVMNNEDENFNPILNK